MKEELFKFTAQSSISILEALRKIDTNKNGFLVVTATDNSVLGILTDGDIRRAFISGSSIEDSIDWIYRKEFIYLKENEDVTAAIDLFKNEGIKFLPILDIEQKLVNIITKTQMHSLLLQDIHADLNYNFFELDESIIDYEIFSRPWGFYKTTVFNEYFQSKVISVNPKCKLSLQSHNHREEHWIVVHGEGTVQIGDSFIKVRCGSSLFIPKGCKHRLCNDDEKESLIITEVQIGDYLGEDDIIRYDDEYGRV